MAEGLPQRSGMRVLIAGGGVAGVEALLALSDLAGRRVQVELLAPEAEFLYRPLTVAEPFGLADPRRLELAALAEEHGARFRQDGLAAVSPEGRRARTSSGATIGYDALLVAVGGRPRSVLPGALTFGAPGSGEELRRLLEEAESGRLSRIVFALPAAVTWPLPLYELALLTASRFEGVAWAPQVTVVTHEQRPLELFGGAAGEAVARLVAKAGVELVAGRRPARATDGGLELEEGGAIEAGAVVTLAAVEGPHVPGLPRDDDGFLPVDADCRVTNVRRVYAAGDATAQPVKQGGLAAQQADAAAAHIARLAGAPVDPRPYRPVIRGALLTGSLPLFLRKSGVAGEVSEGPIWSPPAKLAGRYLAPYLDRRVHSLDDDGVLADAFPAPVGQSEEEHEAVVELALALADQDAKAGERHQAVKWLDAAAAVRGGLLPEEYVKKRREWAGGPGA